MKGKKKERNNTDTDTHSQKEKEKKNRFRQKKKGCVRERYYCVMPAVVGWKSLHYITQVDFLQYVHIEDSYKLTFP
jgi:hypothetical protein